MKKKKAKEQEALKNLTELPKLQQDIEDSLLYDPKYAVYPDPDGTLGLSEQEKSFIVAYTETKSVSMSAELCSMPFDLARKYFCSNRIQREIRRINRAMYYHHFMKRFLTIDELGGYLTSVLTDDNVAETDRLTSLEKLDVVRLIIQLNEYKAMALHNPSQAMEADFDISDLSIETIQQLLSTSKDSSEKEALINSLPKYRLSTEEIEYLKSLPLETLKNIIQSIQKDDF